MSKWVPDPEAILAVLRARRIEAWWRRNLDRVMIGTLIVSFVVLVVLMLVTAIPR